MDANLGQGRQVLRADEAVVFVRRLKVRRENGGAELIPGICVVAYLQRPPGALDPESFEFFVQPSVMRAAIGCLPLNGLEDWFPQCELRVVVRHLKCLS